MAMKRFIIKSVVFILLLYLADAAIGTALKNVARMAKGVSGRTAYIHDSLVADIVVLGSSRAMHHYDARMIGDSLGKQCFNCGEDQMGIIFNYCRYGMIRQRKVPGIIIYDVEPDYDLLEWDNISFLSPLRQYYFRNGVDSVFLMVDKSEKYKMFFNFYAYNSKLLNLLGDLSSDKVYYKGYDPYLGVSEGGFVPEDLPQDKFDPLKLKLIRKFVSEAKADGSIIIFTASPQMSYKSDSVFNGFKRMCRQEGIPFFNHYCDRAYTSHVGYFHDCNHLNEHGAALYTKEIIAEIKSYLEKLQSGYNKSN